MSDFPRDFNGGNPGTYDMPYSAISGRWYTPMGAVGTTSPAVGNLFATPFFSPGRGMLASEFAIDVVTPTPDVGAFALLSVYLPDPVTGIPSQLLNEIGSVPLDGGAGQRSIVVTLQLPRFCYLTAFMKNYTTIPILRSKANIAMLPLFANSGTNLISSATINAFGGASASVSSPATFPSPHSTANGIFWGVRSA